MQTITISIELANAILQYLGTRPWIETNAMIVALQAQAKSQLPAEQTAAPNTGKDIQ